MTNFPILSKKEKKELIDLANEAADRELFSLLSDFYLSPQDESSSNESLELDDLQLDDSLIV